MEEIWKDIPELNGKYQCSNYGRIRRVNKDPRVEKYKVLKLQTTKDGYLSVNPTTTYRKLVHRIVAQLFIDNPNNYPYVNHKDFNTKNNIVDNLEWVTPSGNSKHSNDNNRLGRMNTSVIDKSTGKVYKSIKQAAAEFGYPYKYMAKNIKNRGEYKNFAFFEKAYKSIL